MARAKLGNEVRKSFAVAYIEVLMSVALLFAQSFLPNNKWVIGSLLVLMFGLAIYPAVVFLRRWWAYAPVLAVWAIALGFLGHFVWPSKYPPFGVAIKQYKELGNALSDATEIPAGAYQGAFENGLHIWTENGAYVLWRDKNSSWENLTETTAPVDPEKNWNDDSTVQATLSLPPPCRPPIGSMALEWKRDPQKWSQLGCREFHCPSTMKVHSQDFENGVLIGVFRYTLNGNTPGVVYVLLNKPVRHWETVLVGVERFGDYIPVKGSANCTP